MQEWMIAMLVISIMLIIRDMAKTILAENLPDTEELPVIANGTIYSDGKVDGTLRPYECKVMRSI